MTRSNKKQRGGSPASNAVMKLVSESQNMAEIPETPKLQGDVSKLNLYQTTGGGKKKHRGGSPASNHVMQLVNKGQNAGGATDIRDTLYSRALDQPAHDKAIFHQFTSDEYIPAEQLINEPNTVANPPFLKQSGGKKKKTKKTKRHSKSKSKSKGRKTHKRSKSRKGSKGKKSHK